MSQAAIIGVVVLMMCCCSSSVGAFFLMGDDTTTGPTTTGPTTTGPTTKTPTGPTGPTYTKSCDDLGGGVIERTYGEDGSPITLASCKQKCSTDSDCLGFILQEDGDFCQLHDNNDPYGVDVCASGLDVYRK